MSRRTLYSFCMSKILTQWVGEAWEACKDHKDLTVRSFKKCGITVALDSSEDTDESKIRGLDGYIVGSVKAAANGPESSGSVDSDSTLSDSGFEALEVPTYIQLGEEIV
ncbi:hypothetical protein L211DRAFT_849700 [Terfezia boudieri ATCC MYA-4762]|uniref:Uncharacterized protein n=1 Tax=Terfezia boudieri ATCC MYA-4762 TaxID=1051890 RepID=A0A3N4LKX5_9PEZI|nr:hypothetical protein L211DRAFT_849700 [Terfezia boudieri ATCC MYA-4762]